MSLELLIYLACAFVAGALFGTHLASVREVRSALMAYQLKEHREMLAAQAKASRPPRPRSDFPA